MDNLEGVSINLAIDYLKIKLGSRFFADLKKFGPVSCYMFLFSFFFYVNVKYTISLEV